MALSTDEGLKAVYDARTLGGRKMGILGLQHMFAMFGSTVLVPAITGLSVSATLLFAGIGTLLFQAIAYILPFIGIGDSNAQLFIKGLIILIAVTFDCAKFLKKK